MKEYIKFWKKIFDYRSKSTRKEYFIPQIINAFLILIILAFGGKRVAFALNNIILQGGGATVTQDDYNFIMTIFKIVGIFLLIITIPSIAITIRRYRDAGVAWYWFLAFTVLLILLNNVVGTMIIRNFYLILILNFLVDILQLLILMKPSDSMKKNIFWN